MLKAHIYPHVGAGLSTLALAGAGLTACGGSSGSASTSASNAGAAASTPNATAHMAQTAPAQRAPQVNATGATAAPRGRPVNPQSLISSAQRTALIHGFQKFTSCLRHNGVKVASPNTSRTGPLFNDKGLNTHTPQYKAAMPKCRGALIDAFRESGKARLRAKTTAAKR